MPRLISLAVLLALIIALSMTFFQVIYPFLMPMFLAAMTAIVAQPLQHYFMKKPGRTRSTAAGLTTLTLVSAIMIPMIVATTLASLQFYSFASNFEPRHLQKYIEKATVLVNQYLPHLLPEDSSAEGDQIDNQTGITGNKEGDSASANIVANSGTTQTEPAATGSGETPDSPPTSSADSETEKLAHAENPEEHEDSSQDTHNSIEQLSISQNLTPKQLSMHVSDWVKNSLKSIGDKSLGSTAGKTLGVLSGLVGYLLTMLIGIVIYGMALYYFLAESPELIRATKELIPIDTTYQHEMMAEFSKVVQGVILATFLAALGQGIATVVMLGFLGFGHLFALGALATLTALIPLAGTWVVWIPCAIWLFTQGRVTECIVLSAYCIVVVGTLDNVIRTYVLNSNVRLHPLLAFVSVLGGIQVMGLWGVFIGPIVACCLYAMIKIFNKELSSIARENSKSKMLITEPGALAGDSVVGEEKVAVVAVPQEIVVVTPPKPKKK